MDEEIISTKRFFETHHIILSEYWLESCIQWYREEHPNSNYTEETLHLKVYEQWLLLDLKDVEVPVLPLNLAGAKKMVLNGIFSLQMLYIVDISRSKLGQIQKLRNTNTSVNTTAEHDNQTNNCGRRMLQLILTDGVQDIEAIEYKPISILNANLAPGIKIRITGPITVRRGQMMLEEKHVNILGGEVEDLLVSNAAENILARALNLPLNPNPNIIEETFASANMDVLQNARNDYSWGSKRNENSAQTAIKNSISTTTNVYEPPVNAVTKQLPMKIEKNDLPNQQRVLVKKQINSVNVEDDDELRITAEVEMLLEAERDIDKECKSVKTETPSMFEGDYLDTDTVLKIINTANTNKQGGSVAVCDIKHDVNLEMDKSIFEDMDIDAHLDLIDKQVEHQLNSEKGIVAIGDLLKKRNSITSGKFTIKAKFKSVVQKLTVTDEAWSLKLLITDEVNDMEVHVHTDIISNLMGYCPSAMMELKKDILNNDESATAKVMKTIESLKVKIMKLDCIMEVTFIPSESCPTVTNLK